jgi:hypothetical protein
MPAAWGLLKAMPIEIASIEAKGCGVPISLQNNAASAVSSASESTVKRTNARILSKTLARGLNDLQRSHGRATHG